MADIRKRFTQGHGKSMTDNGNWLSSLTYLITGVATGSTGPTAAELVTGAIGLTGQLDSVDNLMHVLIKLRDAAGTGTAPIGASGRVVIWHRPVGGAADDFFYFDSVLLDKPSGQTKTLKNLPPGSYRFGVAQLTSGTTIDIGYHVSD